MTKKYPRVKQGRKVGKLESLIPKKNPSCKHKGVEVVKHQEKTEIINEAFPFIVAGAFNLLELAQNTIDIRCRQRFFLG